MSFSPVLAPLRLVLTLGLLTPLAAAQSFNIDVGDDPGGGLFGLPASTFGAAAAQPGFWNGLTDGAAGVNVPPPTSVLWYVGTLSDLTGTPTSVTTSCQMNATSNSVGDFETDNPGTSGDDQALMDDCADVGAPPATATWTISGLQNGVYDVYCYAWAPDNSSFITRVNLGGNQQTSGGPWPGGYVLGTTHTRHTTTVTTGTITITISTVSGFGSCNGIQLKQAPGTPVTSFCSGDGTATPCPCGNTGAAGNGCANSVNAAGANLAGTGNASIAVDTFLLQGSGMPNSSALYFQGTAMQGGGGGAVFGDGLRCAGGSVARLGTKQNAAGASQYPAAGDPSVSVRGQCAAGDFRTYQVWYRNAASFCVAATFNLSNGVSVTWVP